MRYEDRFTERARNVLALAQSAAAELGHGYVGSEHILLGLAGRAAAWRRRCCGNPTDSRLILDMIDRTSDGPGEIPPQGLTPGRKRIIELAVTYANRLGHNATSARSTCSGHFASMSAPPPA